MADQATCSFCGKPSDKVVEGPSGQYACWDCLHMARGVIQQINQQHTCSFCLEPVAGNAVVEGPPGVFMCSSCIESGIKLLGKP